MLLNRFKLILGACLIGLAAHPAALAEQASTAASAVTERINTTVAKHWQDNGISPSPDATEGEWVRRVYLDLIGRIPTTHELDDFLRARKSKRRQELVHRLINDDQYAPEFARHWSTIWTNILIGRNGGNERNTLINRAGMRKFLRDSFANNQGYDSMVLELITAEGTNQPGKENFNGAVNFLSMKLADKGTQATADTARIFLGKQVQCTQCHDHPFNDWKQNQFWEFNSFFRQAVALRRFDQGTGMVSFVELTDQDFGGEGGTPAEAEVYYELRDATLKAAYPVFIDGQKLPEKSGYLDDVNRRRALGQYIVSSEDMPRAIVNRMWAHFFNQAFTKPMDDMGPHNPPTHPELLDYLAEQLVTNSFDLRLLMEWIATSDPYALSSRVTKQNAIDDPSKGERPLFSHYYVRQMRAEDLYDSLITATRADRLESRSELDRVREEWLRQFVVEFGNDEGTEGSTFDGTISQSLVLFNGKLMRKALSTDSNGMLYKLSSANVPFEHKVHQLFRSALSRKAKKSEVLAAKQLVGLRGGKQVEGLQDLWWAILNSNEFILNH